MIRNALTVSGLTKQYGAFTLSDISFEVPQGTIAGLKIGRASCRERV